MQKQKANSRIKADEINACPPAKYWPLNSLNSQSEDLFANKLRTRPYLFDILYRFVPGESGALPRPGTKDDAPHLCIDINYTLNMGMHVQRVASRINETAVDAPKPTRKDEIQSLYAVTMPRHRSFSWNSVTRYSLVPRCTALKILNCHLPCATASVDDTRHARLVQIIIH